MFWLTEYKIRTYNKSKATYCSYVVADSEQDALRILSLRGRREKITSLPSTKPNKRRRIKKVSNLYKARSLHACIHTLCFVGLAAVNAKFITIKDLLLDNGLIHDIVHEIEFPEEIKYRKEVYIKLKEFDNIMESLGY